MGNRALWRSLRGLSHPLTIVSVLVLLLNDHVLRVAWPSWWTGKLGDFSWLAFFPLVLAVPLALIVPPRLRRQPEIVAGLAFGLTGLMFASMKTIPAAMSAGLWVLSRITGGPFILRVDPTDLLALPGLLIGWWVWRDAAKPAPASRGWAILALGALATMANLPSMYSAVGCVMLVDGGQVVAEGNFGRLESSDGGITWVESQTEVDSAGVDRCIEPIHAAAFELRDPSNPEIGYRLTPAKSIERTTDGGKTWVLDKDVSLTEAQLAYYENKLGFFEVFPGPVDGVIDPQSGNLIVAMTFEGVWTRTADGAWRGNNSGASDPENDRIRFDSFDAVLGSITIEIVLGILAGFLLVGAFGLLFIPGPVQAFLITAVTLLSGIGWFLAVLVQPALRFPDFGAGLMLGYVFPLIVFGAIVSGIFGVASIRRRCGILPVEVWTGALAAFLLFALPYILWTQNAIPHYSSAMVWALILVVAVVIAAAVTFWRRLRGAGRSE